MTVIALTVDQQAKLIEDISVAYSGLLNTNIRTNGINFAAFDEAIGNLKVALPDVAAHAQGFYFDDMASEADMRDIYPEGFLLIALFVLIDAIAFAETTTLAGLTSVLDALGNDVADLSSYAATWNYENGQFDL